MKRKQRNSAAPYETYMGLHDHGDSGFEINQRAVDCYFSPKEEGFMASDPIEKDVHKTIENDLWLSKEFPLQF